MARYKACFTDDQRQAVILIAIIMNQMAVADRYESLQEATLIAPNIIGSYARYCFAALDGAEKYQHKKTEGGMAMRALGNH